MRYRLFGKGGLPVSEYALGTMTFGEAGEAASDVDRPCFARTPFTTGNTMAACVTIGERAGEMLKAAHGI